MQVVINNCYGGFSLSEKAVNELKKLKAGKMKDVNKIDEYLYDVKIHRHDKDLVSVVDKLGKAASGYCAKLIIEDLQYDIYRISDYDGFEIVEYPNGGGWVSANEY